MTQSTQAPLLTTPKPQAQAFDLQLAFDHALHMGQTHFKLPPGRIDLRPVGPSSTPALVVRGARGLTLEGENTQLRVHGVHPGLWFEACEQLTLRGITLDYATLPFSVGEVLVADDEGFEIRTYSAYPLSEHARDGEPEVVAINEYDPHTFAPAAHGLDCYYQVKSTHLIDRHRLRINLLCPQAIRPGMVLVIRHQVYGHDGITLRRCRGVLLEDVCVHTSPGIGIFAMDSEDCTLERCRVEPPADTDRLISSTADATHFLNCAGTVTLHACRFVASGDDATNVHTLYLSVVRRMDEYSVLAQGTKPHLYPLLIEPDDQLEPTRVDNLQAGLPLTVAEIGLLPDVQQYRIRFTGALPAAFGPGDLLANVTRSPRLRIEGCTVERIRGRGFVVQTRDVLLENNTFAHCQAGGVLVTTFFGDWHEALTTQHVIIRGNRFRDGNQGSGACEGEITISAYLEHWNYGPSGLHRDIVIENNRIERTGNAAIFIGCCERVFVRHNHLEQCGCRPSRCEALGVFFLRNCAHVSLRENTIVAPTDAEAPRYGVVTEEDVATATLELEKNHGLGPCFEFDREAGSISS
jgi:hypothetical protein